VDDKAWMTWENPLLENFSKTAEVLLSGSFRRQGGTVREHIADKQDCL